MVAEGAGTIKNPSGLVGAAVLERDRNGDALWSWVYPTIDDELRGVILSKSSIKDRELEKPRRVFGRYKQTWFYIVTCPVESLPDADLPMVNVVSLVILADKYHPEMYYNLAALMLQLYAPTGSGLAILSAFLSIFTTGSYEDKYAIKDYKDVRKAYLKGSIKSVIRGFGIESILIYIAILLKKRIVVVCPNPEELVMTVRVLPQMVFKRLNWDIIYPYLDTTEHELDELAASKIPYIAGFTDESIADREDLYDIIVDVPNTSISMASHASKNFGLGKIHKEIAMYMTSAAEDDGVKDMDVIKELVERTDTLMEGLNKLTSPSESNPDKMVVTMEAIRARKMPQSMHTFLYNLALAEGMVEQDGGA
eukprot:m.163288 g.163288  ORF g.163288 m.163288 type:complete len:366 (-) comp12291_c0_seq1:111-1208(-)